MYSEDLEFITDFCISCNDLSDEIVLGDGRCLSCVRAAQEESDRMNGFIGSSVYCPFCGADSPDECFC